MKRTARLIRECREGLTLYVVTPSVFGADRVLVNVNSSRTQVWTDTAGKHVLDVEEPLSPADALSRIGYTLERPAPVLELGEPKGEPEVSDLYWVESDNYTGKVFYDSDNCCKHPGGNWQYTTYYCNATWRLITVKEPQP